MSVRDGIHNFFQMLCNSSKCLGDFNTVVPQNHGYETCIM